MADAAFYYGVLRALVDSDRPLWTQMSFDAAAENLHNGAREGLNAQLYWPEVGWVRADELVLRKLLPMAQQGLTAFGVSGRAIDRYLGVIEGRCRTGRTGSVWQRESVAALERRGLSRHDALTQMLRTYTEGMHAGDPVHTWPL
ncbi:MAG: glutamate--cysteine ligase, partial [Mycobacteriaceae bacterium]